MDRQRRKELVEEYRNIKTLMGVIKITNAANGKIFIAGFPNLKNKWFTIGFQLDAGRHPNSGLQSDWKTFSREAFHYEVLEEKPADEVSDVAFEVRQMEKAWLSKLSPFGDRGYNIPRRES